MRRPAALALSVPRDRRGRNYDELQNPSGNRAAMAAPRSHTLDGSPRLPIPDQPITSTSTGPRPLLSCAPLSCPAGTHQPRPVSGWTLDTARPARHLGSGRVRRPMDPTGAGTSTTTSVDVPIGLATSGPYPCARAGVRPTTGGRPWTATTRHPDLVDGFSTGWDLPPGGAPHAFHIRYGPQRASVPRRALGGRGSGSFCSPSSPEPSRRRPRPAAVRPPAVRAAPGPPGRRPASTAGDRRLRSPRSCLAGSPASQ